MDATCQSGTKSCALYAPWHLSTVSKRWTYKVTGARPNWVAGYHVSLGWLSKRKVTVRGSWLMSRISLADTNRIDESTCCFYWMSTSHRQSGNSQGEPISKLAQIGWRSEAIWRPGLLHDTVSTYASFTKNGGKKWRTVYFVLLTNVYMCWVWRLIQLYKVMVSAFNMFTSHLWLINQGQCLSTAQQACPRNNNALPRVIGSQTMPVAFGFRCRANSHSPESRPPLQKQKGHRMQSLEMQMTARCRKSQGLATALDAEINMLSPAESVSINLSLQFSLTQTLSGPGLGSFLSIDHLCRRERLTTARWPRQNEVL